MLLLGYGRRGFRRSDVYCLDKFGVYEYFLTRFTIMLFVITLFVMIICCCGWRAYDSGEELQKKMSWIDARRGSCGGRW